MATEKHKTVLEIGVEDRLLRRFGDTMRRVFSTEPIERHRRAQEKVTRELEKQKRAADQATGAAPAPPGRAGGRTRDPATGRYTRGAQPGAGGPVGGGGGRGGRDPLGFWGTAAATGVGFMGGQMVGRGMGAMTGLARGTGSTQQALGAIPIVGPALQAAVQAAEGLTDMAVGAGQATAMTAGQTGMGRVGGMGMARYGISRQQLPARLAQLAQQSGMRGADLAAMAPEALRTEALTGVSGGVMAGAAGVAGGAVSPEDASRLTQEAIAAGMDAGFRDAKLGTFVQQIAGDIEQMRSRGIMVDPNSLPSMVRMFGQTQRQGLQGEAGLHAARTMTQAVQGAGERNDFYGALAMQTAMDEGMSAFEAQLALEENPEQFVPKILERIGAMGGGDEAKAMALKKFMPNLSMRQAFEMAQMGGSGEIGMGQTLDEVDQLFGGAAARGEQFVSDQEEATQGAFGLAGQAAGLQNRQIGAGERVAGGIMKMRGREIKLASRGAQLGEQAADFASGIIEKYGDALASKDPMGAIFKQLGEDASALFSVLGQKIQDAVDNLAERLTGSKTTDAVKELAAASPDEIIAGFKLAMQDLITFLKEAFAKLPGIGSLFAAAPALPAGGKRQMVG